MADGTVVFGISDKEVAWYEIYCDIQKTRINGNKTILSVQCQKGAILERAVGSIILQRNSDGSIDNQQSIAVEISIRANWTANFIQKEKLWLCKRLEQVAAQPAQQMPVDAAISNAPVGVKTQSGDKIKLDQLGGVFTVPVLINDSLKLHFVLDSGAADVSIPADVVSTLVRTGTITETDFIGSNKYRLADGSIVSSRTFNIKSLKVGDKTITNVLGSVADVNGSLLLGQSFLKKFKSWSLNNETHELILE